MENTQPTLDLNDLNILRQVVSQCAARGAFKPEEFSAVGLVYDRLVAFLEASSAATTETEAETKSTDTSSIADVPVLSDTDEVS